jgi:hypothetical protein
MRAMLQGIIRTGGTDTLCDVIAATWACATISWPIAEPSVVSHLVESWITIAQNPDPVNSKPAPA